MRIRVKRAFTVLELLVVSGIFSMLLALLLPAIGSAVEASRRTSCASKLRQIAQGWHQYHDAHGMLPPTFGSGYRGIGSPSWAYRVLPYLDQQVAFESVNIDPAHFNFSNGVCYAPAQMTAIRTEISNFVCPSDPSPLRCGINYRANGGVGPATSPDYLGPDSGNGVVRSYGTTIVRFRDVTDGLSGTAMLSERARGSAAGKSANAFQDAFSKVPSGIPNSCYCSADDSLRIAQLAADAANGVPQVDFMGWAWLPAGILTVVYKHGQEPGGPIPDLPCGDDIGANGLVAARSWHNGCVETAFADGNVRVISNRISRPLWRAMGTRNGGESLAGF